MRIYALLIPDESNDAVKSPATRSQRTELEEEVLQQ